MSVRNNLICARSELRTVQCLGFRYRTDYGEIVDALVADSGDHVVAYRNVCPHQQVQLSWGQDDFYNADGGHLFCIFHGALFQIDDGLCVRGPCLGEHLQTVAIDSDDRQVSLAAAAGSLLSVNEPF